MLQRFFLSCLDVLDHGVAVGLFVKFESGAVVEDASILKFDNDAVDFCLLLEDIQIAKLSLLAGLGILG